jgi:hypothetical protein
MKMMQKVSECGFNENNEKVFFYQVSSVQVEQNLHGGNMPFTIGIQTKWQKEMMICHGHESGVLLMLCLEQMTKR